MFLSLCFFLWAMLPEINDFILFDLIVQNMGGEVILTCPKFKCWQMQIYSEDLYIELRRNGAHPH